MVYTRSEYTTPILNSLQNRQYKANEIYKLLVTTKITNTLFYNFLSYRMRSEAQKICERENSVEMNEFKSWKLAEIDLKMRALES